MLKQSILAFSMATLMTGCSTIMGKAVDQDVPFDGVGVRVFSFKKTGEIDKLSINNALVSSFEKASVLPEIYNYYGNNGEMVTKGVGVNTVGEDIKVTHYNNFDPLYDEKSAVYKVSIEEDVQDYKVTVNCPSIYHDRAMFRGGLTKEFIPGIYAVKNFNKICENAAPLVKKSTWIKGDFNSKYKSEDVFSNFSRLLNKVSDRDKVKGFDIEKAEVFNLSITNDKKTKLALSVYPYRGGSKVVYAFLYEYSSDSSGNTSYKQSEINSAKKKIVNIAND